MDIIDLIHINENALSKTICKKIIDLFEKEPNKYQGVTAGGAITEIKNTLDFVIPNSSVNWSKIRNLLEEELKRNVIKYINKISKIDNYKIVNTDFLTTGEFMVQKYTRNCGKYNYHNDFTVDHENKKYRVITYIFYLNDVVEGGETEIWERVKIQPKAGQMLLFPACWTFPHRGVMPISDNKYIITGWLYVNY
jgi:hypothetical protein